MTVKQVKNKIEELADKIDNFLEKLEYEGRTESKNYEHLLYIAGGLRELLDSEF